jgi:hypothetical protein
MGVMFSGYDEKSTKRLWLSVALSQPMRFASVL